jgi:hypothetical protein
VANRTDSASWGNSFNLLSPSLLRLLLFPVFLPPFSTFFS